MNRSLTLALVLLAGACKKEVPAPVYQAVPVERRNIVVSVKAKGVVQPDTVVEVKSKASGEVLEMRAETGQVVQRGQLLARIDQRTPRNTLAQAEAGLEVAKARLDNAETQKRRSDELLKSASITTQEHEQAVLAVANAKADLVNAQVNVENARIQMEDTDVLAPTSGTIISKNVERGQVISSPTRDVGGGTVLLKMANLDLVQVRTLVDETDIGKVRPGLAASVVVDAYPNQPFQGEVLKIEPQAETSNNVTMFPVLIRIENRSGLLKPGMNADVDLQVGKRDSVLAIPNAALRTQRDVTSAAQVLGLDSARFQQMLKAADSARAQLAQAGPRPDSAGAAAGAAKGAKAEPKGETMTTPDGREIQLPPGVTAQQVREIFRKRFSGGTLTPEEQATMQTLMRSFRGGAGGGMRRGDNSYQFGGNYIVFVKRGNEVSPVYIKTGLTDLDYAEVISGLKEGDSVVMLPSASLVASQQEFRQRIGSFARQGVPGMRQQQPQGTQTQARPSGGPRS